MSAPEAATRVSPSGHPDLESPDEQITQEGRPVQFGFQDDLVQVRHGGWNTFVLYILLQ
jgi:hypothetical protein